MEKDMENKINTLLPKDKKKFDLTSDAVSQDGIWLSLRGLSNSNPDDIKIILYKELFENDYSRLYGECS